MNKIYFDDVTRGFFDESYAGYTDVKEMIINKYGNFDTFEAKPFDIVQKALAYIDGKNNRESFIDHIRYMTPVFIEFLKYDILIGYQYDEHAYCITVLDYPRS